MVSFKKITQLMRVGQQPAETPKGVLGNQNKIKRGNYYGSLRMETNQRKLVGLMAHRQEGVCCRNDIHRDAGNEEMVLEKGELNGNRSTD